MLNLLIKRTPLSISKKKTYQNTYCLRITLNIRYSFIKNVNCLVSFGPLSFQEKTLYFHKKMIVKMNWKEGYVSAKEFNVILASIDFIKIEVLIHFDIKLYIDKHSIKFVLFANKVLELLRSSQVLIKFKMRIELETEFWRIFLIYISSK